METLPYQTERRDAAAPLDEKQHSSTPSDQQECRAQRNEVGSGVRTRRIVAFIKQLFKVENRPPISSPRKHRVNNSKQEQKDLSNKASAFS